LFLSKFDRTRDASILDFAKRKLINKRILDVGCGSADRTQLLWAFSQEVIGVDLVDRISKERKRRFQFMVADATCLPFREEEFEAVVTFDVIEHIEDEESFMKEAYRVCKGNGYFLLGTPNRLRLSNRLLNLLGKKISYPHRLGSDTVHLREYVMNELICQMNRVGFAVRKQAYLWFGLVGKINIGLSRVPSSLNSYAQYLLVFAQKKSRQMRANAISNVCAIKEKPRIACPICDSNDYSIVLETSDLRLHKTRDFFTLVSCNFCRLLSVNPLPQVDASRFYSQDYFNPRQNVLALFLSRLIRQRKVHKLSKLKKGGRIVDVGCGTGDFLAAFGHASWETWGVDISEYACRIAAQRSVDKVFVGELEDHKFPTSYFDIITMNHSFEHMPNPKRVLVEVHRILKEDGLVFISLPNIESLQFKICGPYWLELDIPRHIYHYSTRTIAMILQRYGFTIQNISFPILEFPMDLSRSIAKKILHDHSHAQRFILAPFLIASMVLKVIPSMRGNMEVIAQKRSL